VLLKPPPIEEQDAEAMFDLPPDIVDSCPEAVFV
jgi:hypothetical protein